MSDATKLKLSLAHRGQVAWNKGIPMREETKQKFRHPRLPSTIEKIKLARKHQVITPEHRRHISEGSKGRKLSAAHIEKISGAKHYRWKGGAKRNMSTRQWRTLREQVLARDNYQCQSCHRRRVVLTAHHVVHHDEGGKDELSNLITWCRSCHVRHHTPRKSTGKLA